MLGVELGLSVIQRCDSPQFRYQIPKFEHRSGTGGEKMAYYVET